MPRLCDREPLGKIVRIEPFLPAHTVRQIVIPRPLDRNVELTVVLLVDRLHPESGDRPLPTNPEDVAMQRHFARFAQGMIPKTGNRFSEQIMLEQENKAVAYSIVLRPPI